MSNSEHFLGLVHQWQQSQDDCHEIELLEGILALAETVEPWPLSVARMEAIGSFALALGATYRRASTKSAAANIERAIASFQRATRCYDREANPDEWATAQCHLGSALMSFASLDDKAQHIGSAIVAYGHAVESLSPISHPELFVEAHNGLGNALTSTDEGSRKLNTERALEHYRRCLAILDPTSDAEQWAIINNNIGAAFAERIEGKKSTNIEIALGHYREALSKRTQDDAPVPWAETTVNLGRAYRSSATNSKADNVERAISLFEAALGVYGVEEYPLEWAETTNELAFTYRQLQRGSIAANYERAREACERSLTVRQQYGSNRDQASSLWHLGVIFRDRPSITKADDIEQALALLQTASEHFARAAARVEWAATEHDRAVALCLRTHGARADNVSRAITSCLAALEVRTRSENPHDWADTMRVLGDCRLALPTLIADENIEAAIGAYNQALQVFTREDYPMEWALTWNNLGNAHRIRGIRLTAASGEDRGSMERDGRSQPSRRKSSALRVRIQEAFIERMRLATEAYEHALTVRTRADFPVDWAVTTINMANVSVEREATSGAQHTGRGEALYRDALSVLRPGDAPLEWAHAQTNLANALRQAKGSASEAVASYRAALTVFTIDEYPRHHLRVARLLGQLHLEAGQWAAAREMYVHASAAFDRLWRQALDSKDEREDVIADASSLFNEQAFALAAMGETEAAIVAVSQGRGQLIALALRGSSSPADGATPTAVPADAGEGAPSTLASLQPALTGSVLVVLIVTTAGGKLLTCKTPLGHAPIVQAFDVPGATSQDVRMLLSGSADAAGRRLSWLDAYNITGELSGLVESAAQASHNRPRYRELLREHTRMSTALHETIDRLGDELWHIVGIALARALEQLNVAPGSRIYWLPSGLLGMLPIGLARNPATGQRLGSTYELATLPSLRLLARRQPSVPRRALATITPDASLASTWLESRVIASYFDSTSATILEGDEATTAAVVRALRMASHWHFGTHAAFGWEDAGQSALQLAKGERLTVAQLIQATALPAPELVYLSACETGMYDVVRNPDEFAGLSTAFLSLGACGVISTLWPVEDRPAALLAGKFFELHVGQGLRPSQALWLSQAWLRSATRAELAAQVASWGQSADVAADPLLLAFRGSIARGGWNARRDDRDRRIRWGRAVSDWVMERWHSELGRLKRRRALERPFSHPYHWAGFVYSGA